ncbi:hypothetical protein Salat_1417000 [Sesamum alatum]|uniref:Uncharacterized protein n=1 Tax=Sesamum alatum TaxID=300844 RepID=A0AAE2CLN0_9LAMI|nr:hypothetical protein Salat_1417000 [Sesamum alatum]
MERRSDPFPCHTFSAFVGWSAMMTIPSKNVHLDDNCSRNLFSTVTMEKNMQNLSGGGLKRNTTGAYKLQLHMLLLIPILKFGHHKKLFRMLPPHPTMLPPHPTMLPPHPTMLPPSSSALNNAPPSPPDAQFVAYAPDVVPPDAPPNAYTLDTPDVGSYDASAVVPRRSTREKISIDRYSGNDLVAIQKFNLQDNFEVKKIVFEQLNRQYHSHRHKLHVHYLGNKDGEDKLHKPPNGISQEDWMKLMNYFESDGFKEDIIRLQSQASDEGQESITEDEAFIKVLGPEKPSRLRGCGDSLKPPSKRGEMINDELTKDN